MRLSSFSPSWDNGSPLLSQASREGSALKFTPAEVEIQRSVELVLYPAHPERRLPERRNLPRIPYPHPVRLTPMSQDSAPLTSETLVVIGRNLSLMGFDFYHVEPLPYRRVIASFELPTGHWLGFLLDLSWCRFGKHGFYDGGGRFLKVVPSPLEGDSAA